MQFKKATSASLRFTGGFNAFHKKADVDAVLRLMDSEANRKRRVYSWWHRSQVANTTANASPATCNAFVAAVGALDTAKTVATPPKFPIIVVEGLDGVGKTTVTTHLAERIGGVLVRTPDPDLEPLRQHFRVLPEPLSRAFYSGANYLAAERIVKLAQERPVVVDRWWASTCAMGLAAIFDGVDSMPPAGSPVYNWPLDLPLPTHGFVLDVPEDLRRKRMAKRGDENAEERVLAAKEGMRRVAMAGYQRMVPMYEPISVPNYCHAINDMLTAIRVRQDRDESAVKSRLADSVFDSARYSVDECNAAPCY